MKNYLISIDNEIKEFYDKFIKNINNEQLKTISKSLSEDIIALLDYYLSPIFINGKNVIQKRLGLNKQLELNDSEQEFIKNYKLKKLSNFGELLNSAVIGCFENRINDEEFYNQLIEIVVSFCIRFFKLAQLIECKNNNIITVELSSDNNNSCSYCQTLSKFPQEVETLIENIDELHPFCKLIINVSNNDVKNININGITFNNLPVNYENKIKLMVRNLNMSIKNLISNKNFEFTDNISNDDSFILIIEEQFGKDKTKELLNEINNQINSFEANDKILVCNKHYNNLDYIITKYLIKDKLKIDNELWWKNQYYKKHENKYIGDNVVIFANPFVTYEAEQNPESYFLESAIYYIINPTLLKSIDYDNYVYLKEHIFNNVEFLRG